MNLSSQTWPTENRTNFGYKVARHRAVEDPDLAHSIQLHRLLRLLVVYVGQVHAGLVVLVEHNPASVIHSVGYRHQWLIDIGDLEYDGLRVPFVGLENQADLADVGNSMVGRGHVV